MDIELNKKAPDFETSDFKGIVLKLSDYEKKKNVLLVLNRGFM